MAQLLQPETETTDPRILRSRRMLMDSLAKLLIKKAFEDISIHEITDEATLNRATFYLHYPDKNPKTKMQNTPPPLASPKQ
ncbi:MAG TPA: TetR/AcrR family transcriptional regulator [Candidatus Polarisedimenticolia bacterium]|nr:TetR/AcrR family transcriptional regulator [Candidatus Polarisedimenticolia bacterium]